MKTRMKRLISLLCVVTLLASTVLSTDFLSVKAETNSGQVEILPTDMAEISFRDFGIVDRENYQGWEGKAYTGETLNNTLFSGTITFPQIAGAYITYAGNGPQVGLGLRVDQDANTEEWYLTLYHSNSALLGTLQNEKIYAETAGVEKLVGVPLELHISMEYLDHDSNGQNNDLKLGIWFGDTLYKNQYIYIDNYVGANRTGNYLTYSSAKSKGGAITLKSANIKLPKDMTEITFRDFGFNDGDYTRYPNGQYSGETLDNTLFGGRITFPESASAHLLYGGKAAGAGFGLVPAQNTSDGTWYLRLYDTKSGTTEKMFNEYKFYSDVAGVPLVGTKVKLHFSTEYVNNDGGQTENDLKLGVWFEGKLYNNQYIYIDNYVDHSHSVGTWMAFNINKELTVNLQSINIELPTDMTEISFRDFGIADGEYTKWKGQTYSGETMDNTLFSGTITFPRVEKAQLSYGGKGNQTGIELVTAHNKVTGEWYLRLRENKNKAFKEQNLYSDVAGVNLVGSPLELHLSLEFVDNDGNGTKNDVKLGVWFDGTLYDDQYIYINNFADAENAIGPWLTYIPKPGGPINLKSSDIKLPKGMKEITFRDFGFVDGELTNWPAGGEYEGESLDNTLFTGKITFPEIKDVFLQYGGKVAGGGFNLGTGYDTTANKYFLRLYDTNQDKSGAKFKEQKFYSDVAGVDLVGKELELNISIEYVDHDNTGVKDDVKLGVWFGGKLYNNNYIYLDNFVDTGHSMGTWMNFYVGKNQIVAIKSVGEIDWKPLPTGMTEITFRDFGFADGNYTQYPEGQYEGETLDNTLFSGKITFPQSVSAHLMYGGKVASGGFDIVPAQDTVTGEWYLRLFDTNQDKSGSKFSERKFYSDVAGVQLVGTELDLKLSLEYIDNDVDGVKNDVKLGVWFGGKLYNNNYIYLKNFVDTGHSMGTWMSFSIAKTTTVSIKSVGEIDWKPLPTGMTAITFRDFGFVDGDYTQYPSGQYEGETLNNTLFGGKITFPENANAHLMYGGKVEAGGFDIVPAQDTTTGEWYLRLFDTNKDKSGRKFSEYKFYSDVAGVTLVGKELELNLSVEYVNHDGGATKNDVKLGVWFGGKLYNNNYIYLKNFVNTGHSMGTWMTFSVVKTTKINIKSVGEINWKPLPEGLTEITFRDFGFTDGDYTKYPNGQYEGKTLDNTLFKGKITFPKYANAFLQYGGKVAGGGFNIGTAQDAATGEWYLRLFDTNQDKSGRKFSEYKFTSSVADVPLIGEELDLMISLQYVDADGDKAKDDVKLGVWFGGKLYNNRYIYLNNFVKTGHSMGTWMAFSIPKATKITIKSVGEINWKPLPTGLTEIGFSDFGIAPGVYEGGSKSGEYTGESLKNTLFSGVVKWHPEVGETHFIYGGTTGGGGFDLVNVKDEETGENYLRLFYTTPQKDGKKKYTNYYFHSDVAGVTLVGEELDLKISIEYVDNDGGKKDNDVRLGIWFAGRLYNNRYIYINNFGATGHILKKNIQIWNRNGASFSVGRMSEWLDWDAFGLNANWKKTLLDTDFNLEYTLAGGNPYTGDDTTFSYLTMGVCFAVIVLCGCQLFRRRRNNYDV